MQAAKDTFLKTLAARLAVVNPARTVTVDGAARAAVIAMENERPLPADAELELETFRLSWEGAAQVTPDVSLMYLDCKLDYGSQGTDGLSGADRGRILTAMDRELMQICEPRNAAKCDYAQTPAAPLGSNIFWTLPVLEAPSEANGVLQRSATLKLFFFPEVA